ncbi:MAG TPA: SDR family oxidoreductase [Longimicrobiaceae bacterium]
MARNGAKPGTAVITGASAGIGQELAKLFAADGYDLVLVARGREGLERVGNALAEKHGVSFQAVPADLTDAAAPEAIFRAVRDAGSEVTALVNNAGFGLHGAFAKAEEGKPVTELRRELEMIQVNVAALTHLTKLFLPEMVARRRGRVLNVASTAAFQAGPFMAVYYATKAYVLSFSEAIALELKGSGVTITTLCPGPTRTHFGEGAEMESSRLFHSPLVMEAPEVARVGYRAMQRGKRVAVSGLGNRILVLGSHLAPRGVSAKIVEMMHEPA